MLSVVVLSVPCVQFGIAPSAWATPLVASSMSPATASDAALRR
jgi:hypothetical protein